jgi:ABC-type multidrug transport system fused ATPase/permease subunit
MEGLLLRTIHKRTLYNLFEFYVSLLSKRQLLYIVLASVLIALLELFGLALLFPFIRLITDVSFFQLSVNQINEYFFVPFFQVRENFLLSVGLGLILFFVLKALSIVLLSNFLAFSSALVNKQSTALLIKSSLAANYKFVLDVGPAKISGMSHSNTAHVSLLFQSVVGILTEMGFLLFMLLALLFIDPEATGFVILLIFLIVVFVLSPLARRVSIMGSQTVELDIKRHRFAYVLARSLRVIKIMGLEPFVIKRNHDVVDKSLSILASHQTISVALRIIIETLMIVAVLLAALWFSYSKQSILDAAPMVATLGIMVARSAPAVSRVGVFYNSFRLSLPVVQALISMVGKAKFNKKNIIEYDIDFTGDYVISGLSFGYDQKPLIKGVDISISQGSSVAIIGSSGAGKSTFLDLLLGLLEPEKGSFSFGGHSFCPHASTTFSKHVGYVSQETALIDASLAFNISLEEIVDQPRLESAIEKSQLKSFVESLPDGLETKVGEGGVGLSGGQMQRIGIARALYRCPSILILDEVTSALDKKTATAIMKSLNSMKGNVTMIFVTHDIKNVDADIVYELTDGRLTKLKKQHLF